MRKSFDHIYNGLPASEKMYHVQCCKKICSNHTEVLQSYKKISSNNIKTPQIYFNFLPEQNEAPKSDSNLKC